MGLVSGLSNLAGVDLRSAKTKMREREARQRAVVDDLAADLIRAIDANAPDFKYIYFQVFPEAAMGARRRRASSRHRTRSCITAI